MSDKAWDGGAFFEILQGKMSDMLIGTFENWQRFSRQMQRISPADSQTKRGRSAPVLTPPFILNFLARAQTNAEKHYKRTARASP